jgi:GNAT superfamily N-acetyltransferase
MSERMSFRKGRATDMGAVFELAERALHGTAQKQGVVPLDRELDDAEIRAAWQRERAMVEFIAAQPGSCWVCEHGEQIAGYARVARFGDMEHLTEVFIQPSHQGRGIGRELLGRVWPGDPSPELGRVLVAAGSQADVSLYMAFGAMPVTGHWHVRQRAERYLERRSHEVDAAEAPVHVLEAEHAVEEWKRLEPQAIGHERPALHEFFGRTRTCLACLSDDGHAAGLCWVSGEGEIGPAVGATAEDLVPVVLATLDRVAKAQEPEELGVFCTTESWWLLGRLRRLGFRLHWPSWVMCSVPLPGLDRYLPTRPAWLL